jgi:hypothetical protein
MGWKFCSTAKQSPKNTTFHSRPSYALPFLVAQRRPSASSARLVALLIVLHVKAGRLLATPWFACARPRRDLQEVRTLGHDNIADVRLSARPVAQRAAAIKGSSAAGAAGLI